MKVLITPRGFANYGSNQVEKMKDSGLEVSYNQTGKAYSHEEFKEKAKTADAIIVGVDLIDKDLINACPNLKVVCKFGVGTDNIDVDYAKSKNIFVGRTIGSNSRAVAEHVIAFMFCHAKNLYPSIEMVREGNWLKMTGSEVYGKTLGIIGFGAIGKHLADYAKGLGMTVIVYDSITIEEKLLKEHQVRQVGLEEIYSNSDYISLHIPLNSQTKDMICLREMKKMKASACLINASRGGIVNENDLNKALEQKVISSAYFDVFSTEPPVTTSDLMKNKNFYLTPHTAARTVESETRTCEISTEIVLQHLLSR